MTRMQAGLSRLLITPTRSCCPLALFNPQQLSVSLRILKHDHRRGREEQEWKSGHKYIISIRAISLLWWIETAVALPRANKSPWSHYQPQMCLNAAVESALETVWNVPIEGDFPIEALMCRCLTLFLLGISDQRKNNLTASHHLSPIFTIQITRLFNNPFIFLSGDVIWALVGFHTHKLRWSVATASQDSQRLFPRFPDSFFLFFERQDINPG